MSNSHNRNGEIIMAFVTLENVYKRYHMGEVTINAADGMTFDIEKGEFAIIVVPAAPERPPC